MFDAGLFRLDRGLLVRSGDSFEGARPCGPLFDEGPSSQLQACEYASNMLGGSSPTVISGAWLIEGAIHDEDTGFWILSGFTALDSGQHGDCNDTHPACNFRHELFLDGRRLWRRINLSDVTIGAEEWYLNHDGDTATIHIGIDPSNARLEISVVPHLFQQAAGIWSGESGVSNVTLKNLVVDMFATSAQRAALVTSRNIAAAGLEDGGWVVENVEVRNSHGRGINQAFGAVISHCHVHHNGQMGLGGGWGTLFASEVAWNNAAGFNHKWEGGGAKWITQDGLLIVANNSVHDNFGNGLWSDIGAVGVIYANNTVINNSWAGISYDISYNGTITNNYLSGNGWDYSGNWLWAAQIQIQNSRDVLVESNTIHVGRGSYNGIAVIQQNRPCSGCADPDPPMAAIGNAIINNTICFDDCSGRMGAVADHQRHLLVEGGTYFDYNKYISPESADSGLGHWHWIGGSYLDFSEFQSIAQQEWHGEFFTGTGACPQ